MLPELCIGLAILGITAYAVLGSADFGAGFWDLTAGGAKRGGPVRGMVQHSMSPVWEANHVWLIFVLVILWTCFPVAFASVFSTLSIPLFLAALGIIFRGAAFVMRGQAATMKEARGLGALFALASVLIPFCLGAAIGGVASGRVPVGNAAGDMWSSWLNPTSVLIGVIGVLTGALPRGGVPGRRLGARGAARARARVPRPRARLGRVTGLVALGGLFVLRSDARDLYDGLTSGGGLAMVLVSGARRRGHARAGVGRALRRGAGHARRSRWRRSWSAGRSRQNPYLLPGQLTLEKGAADDAVLGAVLISMAVGALILGPSLWWLYRLTLSGTAGPELRAARPALPPMRWLPVMLGCLAVGLALMLAFDSWITRLLGVLALFAFIVIGVFLIADPAFLAEEDEG